MCVIFRPDGAALVTGGQGVAEFWRADSEDLLATLHVLREGFLWTTPPDEYASRGWFWTDRKDLIHVTKRYEDGEIDLQALAESKKEREPYLGEYHSPHMVMDRINNWPRYQERLAELLRRMRGQRRFEQACQTMHKALPDGRSDAGSSRSTQS